MCPFIEVEDNDNGHEEEVDVVHAEAKVEADVDG
jgi:hypothetical protein